MLCCSNVQCIDDVAILWDLFGTQLLTEAVTQCHADIEDVLTLSSVHLIQDLAIE